MRENQPKNPDPALEQYMKLFDETATSLDPADLAKREKALDELVKAETGNKPDGLQDILEADASWLAD